MLKLEISFWATCIFLLAGCADINSEDAPARSCVVDRSSWCITGTWLKISFEPMPEKAEVIWQISDAENEMYDVYIYESTKCRAVSDTKFNLTFEKNWVFRSEVKPECYLEVVLPKNRDHKDIAIDNFNSAFSFCKIGSGELCYPETLSYETLEQLKS